jgi:predicted dinucleotide-binding enzyme
MRLPSIVYTIVLEPKLYDTHMVIGHTTSGAEALAAKVPNAHVVSAFSNVRRGKGSLADLMYCGDDEPAMRSVARLIRDVGFNPVDMGHCPLPAI